MKEKAVKVKKEIPKKEKRFKIAWCVFTVILLLLIFIRVGIPAIATSDNPDVLKAVASFLINIADDSVEFKNEKGETHKYYLRLNEEYFKIVKQANKEKKKGKGKALLLKDPGNFLIVEREEADGSRTDIAAKSAEVVKDEKFGDEKSAVIIYFINTITKKFGFDIIDEYYSGKSNDEVFKLNNVSRIFNDIIIFYVLFYIIFSIFTYYQIWSRKYDEKLALEQEVKELNEEYQKGVSKEQAELNRRPKKLTKKQKREMNKK